jgi:hypothetical protein
LRDGGLEARSETDGEYYADEERRKLPAVHGSQREGPRHRSQSQHTTGTRDLSWFDRPRRLSEIAVHHAALDM